VPDSLEELDAELGSGVGYFGRDGEPAGLPSLRGDGPGEDGWQSWWPLPAGGADRPAGGPSLPVPDGLARRTPQANLADELRRNDQAEPERPVRPRRDPAETRSALSRFQATQRAAREDRREPGTEGKDRT
jgi:hypothetical protein